MKRIALLIALALIVSVGGVYATWVYSDAAISNFETDLSGKLSITTAVGDTAKGFLSAPNNVVLTIDDDNGDHIPQWDGDVADVGDITLTFTPNKGATTTTFTYYITVENFEYDCPTHGDDIKIFNPVDEDDTIPGVQICKGTFNYTAGSMNPVTHTLDGDDIQTALNLQVTRPDGSSGTEPLVLESIDSYNRYATALNGVILTLYIVDPDYTPAP